MENLILCSDSEANILNIITTEVAPPLLFYSYIPIVALLVILSFLIFKKNKSSLPGKLLLVTSILSILWVINTLVQWTFVHASFVQFGWEMTGILEIGIYIFAFYFAYSFIRGKDLAFKYKLILFISALPVILTLPTPLNISSFDLVYCEGVVDVIWYYIYFLEATSIVMILVVAIKDRLSKTKSENSRIKTIVTTATIAFLLIFSVSNALGDLTGLYEINLFGPIGMVIFISMMAYAMVRYQVFNVKIFSTQALVVGVWVLVFAILFVQRFEYVRIIVAITLIIFTILGILLVRSVKREREQREKIEKLAADLQIANEHLKVLDRQKSEFVSLASHQLRGPLTSIKGYVSLILEGDFGKISEQVKGALEKVQSSSKDLTILVSDYLDVTRIELGKMKYDFERIDMAKLITDTCNELKPTIENANLKFNFSYDKRKHYLAQADRNKIKQVITNLIDNSLKYTRKGSISINVDRIGNKIRFSITDTGVGIPKDAQTDLFQKFIRAGNANEQNVSGTGLGLFIARKILETHNGRIWVESEGQHKGATFFFEIPTIQNN